MRVKIVCRLGDNHRLFRLCRFIWRRGKGPGVGAPQNYDASVSVALCPPWWFGFRREYDGWRAWFLGVRLHRETSYGGVLV